ncbi:RNA-dependent RNA polymerase 2-like protein [Trifolium pratense]|uniref:RNA-dependent RNA polymerase n=1 Tax=Trifolium pratense TaxID=57577 RepID=A0A2K3KUA6_TRIPR|nr:RNA-dependent RNA polymerase 2-like protein [Trifolium pratense]
MAVDFAKTGAPAEMPRVLNPKEFPDFMERSGKPKYISEGVLGKLYRALVESPLRVRSNNVVSDGEEAYEFEVAGFKDFLETASSHKERYTEKMSYLMSLYGAETEGEMLTGNLQNRASYLQRDKRRYGDMKEIWSFLLLNLFLEDCQFVIQDFLLLHYMH